MLWTSAFLLHVASFRKPVSVPAAKSRQEKETDVMIALTASAAPAPLIEYPPFLIFDLPPDERQAMTVSVEAAEDLTAWWWATPPGFHWSEMAHDTRRQFGDEHGLALFAELADASEDPPERPEYIAEIWAKAADRPLTQYDRLWIDAMAWARHAGWPAHSDVEPFFERLEETWAGEELKRRVTVRQQWNEFNTWMGEVVAAMKEERDQRTLRIETGGKFAAGVSARESVVPNYRSGGILRRRLGLAACVSSLCRAGGLVLPKGPSHDAGVPYGDNAKITSRGAPAMIGRCKLPKQPSARQKSIAPAETSVDGGYLLGRDN